MKKLTTYDLAVYEANVAFNLIRKHAFEALKETNNESKASHLSKMKRALPSVPATMRQK